VAETTFEFDEDGFLTHRRDRLEASIRGSREPLFARAHAINRDCHSLVFSADVHNADPREMLVATSFIRALEHYQAAVLLLVAGLVAPAKAGIRATLEAVFTTRAIARDEAALKAFILNDLLERQRLIRKAQQHEHTNLVELRGRLTAEFVRGLEAEIKTAGVRRQTAEELSKLAGMHDWYMTAYAMLSQATHTAVRELECYLAFDPDGTVRSVEYAPSFEDISWLLLTAMHCILLGGDAVAQTFRLGYEARAEHLHFIEAEFASLGPTSDNEAPRA
jgi:hypothetical protein